MNTANQALLNVRTYKSEIGEHQHTIEDRKAHYMEFFIDFILQHISKNF